MARKRKKATTVVQEKAPEATVDTSEFSASESSASESLPNTALEALYTLGELGPTLESMIFASGSPLSIGDLKRALTRHWKAEPEQFTALRLNGVKEELQLLCARWERTPERGFYLLEVAQGFAFRTNPDFADMVRDLRAQKPARLSRAALETLSIVAYRQPATKPEIDHIRGVDCGGTIRMLLERGLVRIVGKKEEPGRPLLYGTSREFLSFFNLGTLSHLPSLRELNELSEESSKELAAFDGLTELAQLDEGKSRLQLDTEPDLAALDEAMQGLSQSEERTSTAFSGDTDHADTTETTNQGV